MSSSCTTQNYLNQLGCPDPSTGICPDFKIKRHDTTPPFAISVKDCNDPIDLTDTVVEVSMWADAKFRRAVAETDTYFALADNIGFQQAMVGDIIVVSEQVRAPEQMLITGFDEANKLIRVQREYTGTTAWPYKKGTRIQIFRFLNSVGTTEMTLTDVLQTDGTTEEDVLTDSKLIYEWAAQDTCLPGCYYIEMKLLKMRLLNGSATAVSSMQALSPDIVPSFVSPSAATLCCALGEGVEWQRRFPVDRQGFLIQIVDSPTSECLV